MSTTNLYQNLKSLIASDDSFYSTIVEYEGRKYEIFNYRLVPWSSFMKPDALWCRGTMFDITTEPFLVCRPPEKCFNWGEGNVSHHEAQIVLKMEKLDGSLISSFLHNGELKLKSKGSLASTQAIAAKKWLDMPENVQFRQYVEKMTKSGHTVSMEYCSPSNRIVVGYMEESLKILNAVVNETGETKYPIHKDLCDVPWLVSHDIVYCVGQEQQDAFVKNIAKETVGEGYVLVLRKEGTSYAVKCKNDAYVLLHKTKDSITSPRALFECVIDSVTDDLKAMFLSDPVSLMIQDMESKVIPKYNKMISDAESFHSSFKHLERKDYAITAKYIMPQYMGLLMELYLGREPKYTEFAKKNMNMFLESV